MGLREHLVEGKSLLPPCESQDGTGVIVLGSNHLYTEPSHLNDLGFFLSVL